MKGSILALGVVAALATPVLVRAQESSFSGRVVNHSARSGVANATVSIVGLPGTVRTDAEGRFTWKPRPEAPFQIIVILSGGQVASPFTVERLDDEPVTVTINPLAEESLSVVGSAPSITATPAAATTMLSGRQIAQRSPEHLLQAVETVPGITHVSEGHAAAPAIRGMARGRTLLLIDGGRVTSERRAGPSATFADPSTFEGIDIARGPGSVAYGSDALGGIISIRTKSVEAGSPLRIRASGTLGAGIPDRRGTVEVSKGLARGGVLLQAHGRSAGDWDSPEGDGEIFNSGWEDRGFLARVEHQLGRGIFSAGLQSDFGRDIERPRNNSNVVRFYYPYEDSHRVSGGYTLANVGTFQRIEVNAFLGSFEQRTEQDRFATATTGRSIERADLSANDFHVKGSAIRAVGPARVETGVDVNGRYDLEALEVRIAYDPAGAVISDVSSVAVDTARRTDVGAYLQTDVPVAEHIRLSGGIRGDRVTTRSTGGFFGDRSTDNGSFSGFAAATLSAFHGFSLIGQISRGFRDPTLSDRYYRGPSGRGFITGDPNLLPETSLQYDVTVRYARGRTQLATSLYHYRIADLIERYQTATDFFFFRNRGHARLRGFEVEAHTTLPHGLSVELGAAFGRGVALDDNAHLDDIAPDTFSALIRQDFGDGFAQIRTAVLARDDRPGPSEVAAPGASLLDLAGGYTLFRNFEIRANARNLLDDSYYASPDPRWVYAPGRSLSVTVAVQY